MIVLHHDDADGRCAAAIVHADDCCNCGHGGQPSRSTPCLTCVPPTWLNWMPKRSPIIYHYAERMGVLGRLARMVKWITDVTMRRPKQ